MKHLIAILLIASISIFNAPEASLRPKVSLEYLQALKIQQLITLKVCYVHDWYVESHKDLQVQEESLRICNEALERLKRMLVMTSDA